VSSISISRADVEAVIDRNPWDLVREFDGNTDPEVIASLSRIFHNGVAEAEESGSVAEYASNLAERAGSQGVNAIYEDAAGHLEETYAGLGAETMASISRTLLSISEEAARVLEFNQEALEGEHGVNRMINWHAAQGSSEYQAIVDWHAEQSTEVAAETQLVYNIHGRSFQGTPNEFPFDDAKAGIKEGRTELAGEYAEEVHDGIDDEIGEYYAYLGRREAELAEQGYDVSTSPVNFYYTPEIAAYHAEKIAEALAALEHNENDPQALAALEHSTHAMGELAGRFFDADGNPVGTMSDQQLEYLRTVFDGLDADHLVTIGHLDIEGIDRVQENLGNGILLLTNPDVGGIDPDLSATSGPQAVPASIRDLMYEVVVGA
jgi:hypothetical protein